MKWIMLACALVAMSWPAPVTAQPTGIDTLIVPGQRIGPIRLGMDQDEVIRILGEPSYIDERPEWAETYHVYGGRNTFLGWLVIGYNRSLAPQVQDILTADPRFATDRGIRPGGRDWDGHGAAGSSGADVVRAYGRPKKETCQQADEGLACFVNYDGMFLQTSRGRVVWIRVE